MRIYVGNLPYETTDDQLRDLFADYGNVGDAKIIIDRETERSKGFGFVELPDDAASKAIADLHHTDFGGRNIVVNEAKEKTRKDRFDGRGGAGKNRSW
jgi:RNA recognition motif-containing protein